MRVPATTDPDTISADYTLRPSELADTLALLVEARQTTMVWGPPGSAKSQIAQQVAHTDADLIKTAIGRVVLACALKHHTRRGERDPERWQRASQLVTHGLLRDAGFKLPTDAEAWDGISVEKAYDRLPEPQDGEGGEDTSPPSSAPDGGGDATALQSDGGDDDDDDDPSHGDDPQGDDAPGESLGDDPQDQDASSEGCETGAPPSFDPSGTE